MVLQNGYAGIGIGKVLEMLANKVSEVFQWCNHSLIVE
jgi:hypothetical protein